MKMYNKKGLQNVIKLIMNFNKPIRIVNKLKHYYKESLIVKKPIKLVHIQNTN